MLIARLIGFFFACCGIALLVAATLLYRDTRTLLAHAVSAQGTVVDMVNVRGRKGSLTYAPVVRFTDQAGIQHQFKSSTSQNPPAYQPGQQNTVLYDPNNPQDARLNGFSDLWLGPLIAGGMGVAFSAVGCGVFVGSFTRFARQLRFSSKETHASPSTKGR